MKHQHIPIALLSVADTQLILGGIGRTKLYALINSGTLHPIKLGRRTFFKDTEIAGFIADLGSPESRKKLDEAQSEVSAGLLESR